MATDKGAPSRGAVSFKIRYLIEGLVVSSNRYIHQQVRRNLHDIRLYCTGRIQRYEELQRDSFGTGWIDQGVRRIKQVRTSAISLVGLMNGHFFPL